jgi:hypothetical protein
LKDIDSKHAHKLDMRDKHIMFLGDKSMRQMFGEFVASAHGAQASTFTFTMALYHGRQIVRFRR